MKNTNKIKELRETTFEDLINKLRAHRKCALIRPCSFGKTVMATKLFERYKNVLFLYPSDCLQSMIKARYQNRLHKNIRFMSYNRLARLTEIDINNLPKYDLIFADEAHCLGAEKTKVSFFYLLMTQNEDTDFVGSTATPDRMDGFDFVAEFFEGLTVYPYTLHDAISDGVIKKPHYYYCTLNPKKELKERFSREFKKYTGKDPSSSQINKIITRDILSNLNIYSVENTIKEACNKHLKSTKYMKFICFCQHISSITDGYKMVASWFEKAFPNHKIRKTEIHSGIGSVKSEDLERLEESDNTIDLVFSCNMLNEGYHVGNINGIVMLRKTASNRIYTQQIGRCLSSDEDAQAKIIIDVVDNIHHPALFKENHDFILPMIGDTGVDNNEGDNDDFNTSDNEGCGDSDVKFANEVAEDTNVDKRTDADTDKNYKPVFVSGANWYLDANRIGNPDVDSISYEARYDELAFKLVCEAKKEEIEAAFRTLDRLNLPPFTDRNQLKDKNLPFRILIPSIAKANGITESLFISALEIRNKNQV